MHLVFSFSVIHVYFFLPFKKKNEGISRQETSCVNLTRHFLRCAGAGRVSSVPKPTPPHPYFLYWWWYPKISWTHFNPSISKNKKKMKRKHHLWLLPLALALREVHLLSAKPISHVGIHFVLFYTLTAFNEMP